MALSVTKSKKSTIYHFLMVAVIVSLACAILNIISQMAENRSYSLSSFIFVIVCVLIISSISISILIVKFSIWLRRGKNLHELLYVIAFSFFLLTLVSAMIGLIQELGTKPSPVTPIPNPWDRMGTLKPIYYDLYRICFFLSFGLVWVATSIFLKNYTTNYSKRIGKWKFWILATLPMVYYLFSFDFIINNLLSAIVYQAPNLSTTVFLFLGSTKQVGGFFFALSFLFMAKNTENVGLKYYLTLAATGIMTLFGSIQISTLHILPYPPFGLISLSIMPFSSYLVLVGLYYSARSISYDKQFLLRLKKYVKKEPESFLNAIGSSEWNRNLERTVSTILREVDTKEIDFNLSEVEIKNYVFGVIKELERDKH